MFGLVKCFVQSTLLKALEEAKLSAGEKIIHGRATDQEIQVNYQFLQIMKKILSEVPLDLQRPKSSCTNYSQMTMRRK